MSKLPIVARHTNKSDNSLFSPKNVQILAYIFLFPQKAIESLGNFFRLHKLSSLILYYFLINNLGGMDEALSEIKKISGYISFDDKVIYKDYSGKEFRTTGTISCYDMGQYLSYIYRTFTINPQVNQRLLNDLAANEVGSPLSAAFPEDTRILHVLGRNTDRKAYMECAIVDYKEPFALIIYVEAASSEAAGTAIATLGSYTQKYIEQCYK